MKLYFASVLLSIAVMLGAMAPAIAQNKEYDDLYFNASDRKTIAYEKINEPTKASYDSKGSYKYEEESLSAKNVNPEYIAKYQAPEDKKVRKNDSYSSQEYYVEEEDRAEYQDRDVKVYNNYYGSSFRPNPYSSFGSPFYDPFYYDPFYDPFYSPFRPYSSRFNISLGFGFGTAWGYNSSWYGRPYYGGFYDPFYRPYGGYYNGFYDGFYTGLYGGYGRYPYYYRPTNVIIVNPGETVNTGRTRYTYGPGYSSGRSRLNANTVNDTRSRGVGVSRNNRTVSNSNQSVTTKSTRNGRVTTQGRTFDSGRDFSATQNEYYNRSRNNLNTDNTNRSRNVYSSPATRNDRSVNTNRGTRSYTARPASPSNNRSNTYSRPSREYSSSPSRSNNSNNRSSNYSRSRSSSPSYSTPSRSSSPSYSTPSRSSSPSYSTPSRSSSSGRSGRRP